MAAITISDLDNAKLDVDHIAALATSLAFTATDRLGHSKLTMAGAIDTLKAFNFRGAFAGATAYAVKDIYNYSGVTYAATVAHTSTSVAADLAAGKVVVYSGQVVVEAGTNDWNELTTTGFYHVVSNSINGIPGFESLDSIALVVSSSYGTFQVANSKLGKLYFRSTDNNTTWSNWQEVMFSTDVDEKISDFTGSDQLLRAVGNKQIISVASSATPYIVKAGDYTKIHRSNAAGVVFDCTSLEPGKTYIFTTYQYSGCTAELDFGPALKWVSTVDIDTQKKIKLVEGQGLSIYCISNGYYMVLSGYNPRLRSYATDNSYFYEREDNGEYFYTRKFDIPATTSQSFLLPTSLQGTDQYRVRSITSTANTDSAVVTPHVKTKTNTTLVIRNTNAFTVTVEFSLSGLKPT